MHTATNISACFSICKQNGFTALHVSVRVTATWKWYTVMCACWSLTERRYSGLCNMHVTVGPAEALHCYMSLLQLHREVL